MSDEVVPLYTIEDSEGKPYISVIDEGNQIKLQLHKYDLELFRPIYLTIDKRALPALVATLASIEL